VQVDSSVKRFRSSFWQFCWSHREHSNM